jgi:hypothetical protein
MTQPIERYLRRYTVRRRRVAAVAAMGWAMAFAIAWLLGCRLLDHRFPWGRSVRFSIFCGGILIMVAIVSRPLADLFRRWNPVRAATELEARRSDFDQRLITVASQPPDSPLLVQLQGDVEALIAAGDTRSLVPLRPLLAPGLALIASLILLGLLRNNFDGRSFRMATNAGASAVIPPGK